MHNVIKNIKGNPIRETLLILPLMERRSSSVRVESSSPPSIPWKEMFCSASFRQPDFDPSGARQSSSPPDPADQLAHSSNALQIGSSRSCSLERRISVEPNSSPTSLQSMPRSPSFSASNLCPSILEPPSPEPHSPMGEDRLLASSEIILADAPAMELESNQDTCPTEVPPPLVESHVSPPEENPGPPVAEINENITGLESLLSCRKTLPRDPNIRVALYITMAQAGLAVIAVLFYVTYHLLDEYLRPVVWAAVCSIPLRGIQDTLVEFWTEPLRSGLTEAALAVPVAVMKVLVGTIMDARDVYCWMVYGTKLELSRSQGSGFLRLVRRLLSFGIFVLAYEQIGATGTFALVGMGLMLSSNLSPSTISALNSLRSDDFLLKKDNDDEQGKISTFVARSILRRLKAILAMGLIMSMIVGVLAGVIFFTYRIGVEGKDAMDSIKSHMVESNYAQNLGLKGWIDENEALDVVDRYTDECYEALSSQIDDIGIKYNLTDFIGLMRQLVVDPGNSSTLMDPPKERRYYFYRLRSLKSLLTELLFSKEEGVEKAKCFVAQGLDMSLQALAKSKFILDASADILISIGRSMVSGAAGILHLFLQVTVFFWVLYYLLTSETSGVTEQVVKMLPMSNPTKKKTVDALNHAVSDVLLATAEIAFFQGCFTWLICRLYSVHFVYMSTMLAFISSLLPIFPPWLPTVPAALQLAFDGRYMRAITFCVTHLVLMDYGASEIVHDIPGYSAYLTGVSIIGGMTLFPSAFEGAIMGPLITTVVIALKDLYVEFVLNEAEGRES